MKRSAHNPYRILPVVMYKQKYADRPTTTELTP